MNASASATNSAPGAGSEHYDLTELAKAKRLSDWMFAQFRPHADGRVAEVGAGIGTFSQRLLQAGVEELLLLEPDPALAGVLRENLGSDPRVRIVEESLPDAASLQPGTDLDFVLCQNVLEHIEDDSPALATLAGSLRPGGRLTVLVPAHPRLYNSIDLAFSHHRRYSRERLRMLAAESGLEVNALYSFNLLGVAGWWVKGRRGASQLGSGSLRAYEALVRAWRPVEDRLDLPWGLSLVLQARRPGPEPGAR